KVIARGESDILADGCANTACGFSPCVPASPGRLWQCCLTEASCEALASVLRTNRSLTELHLGDNELGDGGMRRLCEGLRDSACRVRILR
uniref:Uncharacterized protein n=1 Tax=Dromaius novaehollandiae TaxID=8790 RepID=A0A8C4J207_DRONO